MLFSKPTASIVLALGALSAVATTTSCTVASLFDAPIPCDLDVACPSGLVCLAGGDCGVPPSRVPSARDRSPGEAEPAAVCETRFHDLLAADLDGVCVREDGSSSAVEDDAVVVDLPPTESVYFASVPVDGPAATTVRFEVPILDGEPLAEGQQYYVGLLAGARTYELILFGDGLVKARFVDEGTPQDLDQVIPALQDAPHPIRLVIEAAAAGSPVMRMALLTRDDTEVFAAAFPAPSTEVEEFYFAAQNFQDVDSASQLRVGRAGVVACD